MSGAHPGQPSGTAPYGGQPHDGQQYSGQPHNGQPYGGPVGPYPPSHPRPPVTQPGRPGSPDLVVSVILMVMGVLGLGLFLVMSMFFAMMAAACTDDDCNGGLLSTGWTISLLAPAAVYLAAVIWGIVRLARRRRALGLALVSLIGPGVAWGIGLAIMYAALG